MVNEYVPPEEKTIADFREEIELRVQPLQLPGFPQQVNDQMIQDKLQGKLPLKTHVFTMQCPSSSILTLCFSTRSWAT